MDRVFKNHLSPLQPHAHTRRLVVKIHETEESRDLVQHFGDRGMPCLCFIDCEGQCQGDDQEYGLAHAGKRFRRTNIGAAQKVTTIKLDTHRAAKRNGLVRGVEMQSINHPRAEQKKQQIRPDKPTIAP